MGKIAMLNYQKVTRDPICHSKWPLPGRQQLLCHRMFARQTRQALKDLIRCPGMSWEAITNIH